jgi:Tol biopolymer transport system component
MRIVYLFVMVVVMSVVMKSQTLPAPKAITDPKEIASKPDARVEKNLSIEKLYMTRQVGGATWSPDGKTVAFISNLSGRNNLWLVNSEGGWPTQLTVSDERQTSPTWSPDGKWIANISDYEGDEQSDIFLVSPKTGQVMNLTNTREIAEEEPAWSSDGRYLAYMVKPKTSSVFEIDVYDTVLRDVKHLTTGTAADRMNVSPIWSADGAFIVYTQEQAKGTDSNIFIVDVANAQSTLLTPHDGEKTYSANDVSPDGKTVLITSNAADGYNNVGLLDIASKKIHWVTQDKWEISGENFSPDGKLVIYTANVDGNTDIYLYDVAAGKSHALDLPKGVNFVAGRPSPFTRDGSRMLYVHNGPTAPGDLWVHSLAEFKGKSKGNSVRAGTPAPHLNLQLTHSLVGGVRPEDRREVDYLRVCLCAI